MLNALFFLHSKEIVLESSVGVKVIYIWHTKLTFYFLETCNKKVLISCWKLDSFPPSGILQIQIVLWGISGVLR